MIFGLILRPLLFGMLMRVFQTKGHSKTFVMIVTDRECGFVNPTGDHGRDHGEEGRKKTMGKTGVGCFFNITEICFWTSIL